eukprot:SAG31_NODE_15043_length_773_cov_1.410979_1_plen_82_part_00
MIQGVLIFHFPHTVLGNSVAHLEARRDTRDTKGKTDETQERQTRIERIGCSPTHAFSFGKHLVVVARFRTTASSFKVNPCP